MKSAPSIKFASIGSVCHGSLRTEDLLSDFSDELDWQIRRNGEFFSQPENFPLRDKLASLVGRAQDCFSDDGKDIREEKQDEAEELVNEDLVNALNTHFAPPYVCFGSHQGDGSDFGFWPDWSSIEELETVEDGESASIAGDDCKAVNDHGNVTVWSNGVPILGLV